MAEANDYFLTEDELKTRFEERVIDHVFGPYQPQTRPVLVLVGGQQAAGKSQAIAHAQLRHADNQLVPLTGDDLRFMHPDHDADAHAGLPGAISSSDASTAWSDPLCTLSIWKRSAGPVIRLRE